MTSQPGRNATRLGGRRPSETRLGGSRHSSGHPCHETDGATYHFARNAPSEASEDMILACSDGDSCATMPVSIGFLGALTIHCARWRRRDSTVGLACRSSTRDMTPCFARAALALEQPGLWPMQRTCMCDVHVTLSVRSRRASISVRHAHGGVCAELLPRCARSAKLRAFIRESKRVYALSKISKVGKIHFKLNYRETVV